MVQRGYAPTPPPPPPEQLSPRTLETLSNMLSRGADKVQPGPAPNVSPVLGNMQQFGVNAAQGNPPLPSEPVPPQRYVSDALQQRLQRAGIPNLPTLGRGLPSLPLLKGGK